MLVEDTAFSKCYSSTGAAILFDSQGQFSQQRVCSYRSTTSGDGIFCMITSPSMIYLLDTSISLSGDESNTGQRNVYLIGSVNVSSINISHAKTKGRCIFEFNPINTESRTIYSTFSNNSHNDIPAYFSYMNGSPNIQYKMQYCNYLDNKGDSFSKLVTSQELTSVISNCSFQRNNPHQYRFYKASGSMTIEYCFITDNLADNSPTVTNKLTTFYTAFLSHLSSNSCQAERAAIFSINRIIDKKETFDYNIGINRFIMYEVFICSQ